MYVCCVIIIIIIINNNNINGMCSGNTHFYFRALLLEQELKVI